MRHLTVPAHAKRHPGGKPDRKPCTVCARIRAAAAALANRLKAGPR